MAENVKQIAVMTGLQQQLAARLQAVCEPALLSGTMAMVDLVGVLAVLLHDWEHRLGAALLESQARRAQIAVAPPGFDARKVGLT